VPYTAGNGVLIDPANGDQTITFTYVSTITTLKIKAVDKDNPTLVTWSLRFSPVGKDGEKPSCSWGLRRVSLDNSAPIKMRVISARPMASVVKHLERRFGVVITYEDPVYAGNDILGTPGTEQSALRGGIINLEWTHKQDSAEAVLTLLMETTIEPRAHRGMFRLEKADQTHFHVVPVKTRNEEREDVPYASPWSVGLTPPVEGGPVPAFVERLCDRVSSADGAMVVSVVIPDGLAERLRNHKAAGVQAGANEDIQTSRTALAQTLWAVDASLSWQMWFDPRTQKHELRIYDSKGDE